MLGSLLIALATAGAPAASAASRPANCTHETRTATGAVNPAGLCVSYGYGIRPAGSNGPETKNISAYAQGTTPMPFDYYVRSDVAEQIAAGTARPRGAYVLLYGGAFICGSRADLATQARELARRGYVVVAPEYPLSQSLNAYGYFNPNAPYRQAQITQRRSNPCDAADQWLRGPDFQRTFLRGLHARGLEPALQQGQWVLQTLIRRLKSDASLGVDGRRIFAIGSSAGGSLAIRLALGGNQDQMPSGPDPGDSTIAGALSISGSACFPESAQITTPMLLGVVRPSEVPPCHTLLDRDDPPFVMLQEPRGGADDPVVPTELMERGCRSINTAGYAAGFGRRCIYEDRRPQDGGYIADGEHAALGWSSWLRLFDVLGEAGNFGQP